MVRVCVADLLLTKRDGYETASGQMGSGTFVTEIHTVLTR